MFIKKAVHTGVTVSDYPSVQVTPWMFSVHWVNMAALTGDQINSLTAGVACIRVFIFN